MRLIWNLLIQISAFASLLGLYLEIDPPTETRPSWHWWFLGVFCAFAAASTFREIWQYAQSRPKSYSSKKRIKRYMRHWVASGDRAVILSRDLSWVDDPDMKSVLIMKAKKSELTIYIQKEITLSDELKSFGAEIVTYSRSGHSPRSRFTIINYGKEGARVAIGAQSKGKHVIEEFESGQHPIFAVADDLTKFIAAYEGKLNANP